jgi:hypothetical protein
MKKWFTICVCLVIFADVLGQSRSKTAKQPRRVKQTPEVLEAYRVCGEFQRLLAENFDFDRAFESTFTKDPARRREVAIAEGENGDGDLAQVDTGTLIRIYKNRAQLLILLLPLAFGEPQVDLAQTRIDEIFKRKRPEDPQKFQEYAAQLNRDVAAFRAYVEELAQANPNGAEQIRKYKEHLSKPLVLPNRVVKPMTAYSHGRVLRANEEYYQIDDCAVIREDGQMRLIGYTFLKMRF